MIIGIYIWFFLIGGIVLGIVGGIMLAIALSHRRKIVVQPRTEIEVESL